MVTTLVTIAMAVVTMVVVVRTVTEAMALHTVALPTVHHLLHLRLQLHLPSNKAGSLDWRPVKITGCQSLDLEG